MDIEYNSSFSVFNSIRVFISSLQFVLTNTLSESVHHGQSVFVTHAIHSLCYESEGRGSKTITNICPTAK